MTNTTWQALLLFTSLLAVAEAIVMVGVLRHVGSLLLHVSPAAPRLTPGGPELGEIVSIPNVDLKNGRLRVFIAPGCEPCEELAPSLPILVSQYPDSPLVAVIARGTPEERVAYAASLGIPARPEVDGLAELWHVDGTPFAAAVDRAGVVRLKGIVNTLEQLTTMAEAARSEPSSTGQPGHPLCATQPRCPGGPGSYGGELI